MTNRIMEDFPAKTYTIISPTDELYQVAEDGWHEETLTFLQKLQFGNYSIPSEYLFVYVEKKPIQYAQSHFYQGPQWLAQEKYTQYYSTYYSEGDDINHSFISDAYIDQELAYFSRPSQTYSDLVNRTILESKLDAWCKKFQQAYPHDMNVYYEDDDFVCYVVKQNTYRLFNLEE